MEFSPPEVSKPPETKRPAKAPKKKRTKLKLVFDLDIVKKQETSVVTNDGKSRASINCKAMKKTDPAVHAESIDPNAAVEAAASIMTQKAQKAANLARAKYAPNELEIAAYGGNYHTMINIFGNILPVVYIANQPCPLNEKTLLESRIEAASNNFDIIPQHADNTVVEL